VYFDRIRNNRKRLTLVRLAIVPRSPGVVRNLLPHLAPLGSSPPSCRISKNASAMSLVCREFSRALGAPIPPYRPGLCETVRRVFPSFLEGSKRKRQSVVTGIT